MYTYKLYLKQCLFGSINSMFNTLVICTLLFFINKFHLQSFLIVNINRSFGACVFHNRIYSVKACFRNFLTINSMHPKADFTKMVGETHATDFSLPSTVVRFHVYKEATLRSFLPATLLFRWAKAHFFMLLPH